MPYEGDKGDSLWINFLRREASAMEKSAKPLLTVPEKKKRMSRRPVRH